MKYHHTASLQKEAIAKGLVPKLLQVVNERLPDLVTNILMQKGRVLDFLGIIFWSCCLSVFRGYWLALTKESALKEFAFFHLVCLTNERPALNTHLQYERSKQKFCSFFSE